MSYRFAIIDNADGTFYIRRTTKFLCFTTAVHLLDRYGAQWWQFEKDESFSNMLYYLWAKEDKAKAMKYIAYIEKL